MKQIFLILSVFWVACLHSVASPVLNNGIIEVSINPSNGQFTISDLRNGGEWRSHDRSLFVIAQYETSDLRLEGQLYGPDGLTLTVHVELAEQAPEFSVSISGSESIAIHRPIPYPYALIPRDRDLFILPEHGGVGIPVQEYGIMDRSFATHHVSAPMYNRLYRFFSGHDLSMTFWGYAGNEGSCMKIVETPNDAGIRVQSVNETLIGGIEWQPSREQFGYTRTIRYVFFDEGGYNAIAKRYRDYAFEQGWLKTLEQKAASNPDVSRFMNTALIWIFSPDTDILVPEMMRAGMKKISVTSPMFTPGEIRRMNEAGVLNGIYDVYRSVLPPQYMPKVRRVDPTDVRDAYPDDIILMANGEPFDWGWPKQGIDGEIYRTLDVCDTKQKEYLIQRLDQTLANRPMSIRFFDTTTAFPWTECFHPDHPTTRSQVREARMQLLDYTANERGMVVGAEAGHIFAVPYATYFEGIHHSRFFYYQIPGHPLFVHDHTKEIPEQHRLAMREEHRYRLPLLQLVAGDCVVAHTRWNTPNNKIHHDDWWDHKDLWNILYGLPPMYMFINETMDFWETYKDRYLQSYHNVVEDVLGKTAGQEMISHRFLSDDQDVQQTLFANGTQITVNFGDLEFVMDNGESLAARAYHVDQVVR